MNFWKKMKEYSIEESTYFLSVLNDFNYSTHDVEFYEDELIPYLQHLIDSSNKFYPLSELVEVLEDILKGPVEKTTYKNLIQEANEKMDYLAENEKLLEEEKFINLVKKDIEMFK